MELSHRVWNEHSLRKVIPDQLSKPLVYVGITGLDPDLRLDRHKLGIQANRFVLEYGLRLLLQLTFFRASCMKLPVATFS